MDGGRILDGLTQVIRKFNLRVAQMVKNLFAMQETWVQSLGQKDLLEKGMATHSSILAWRIPWTEEIGGIQFMKERLFIGITLTIGSKTLKITFS